VEGTDGAVVVVVVEVGGDEHKHFFIPLSSVVSFFLDLEKEISEPLGDSILIFQIPNP